MRLESLGSFSSSRALVHHAFPPCDWKQAGNTMSYYCITIDGAFPGGQEEMLTFLWTGKGKQSLIKQIQKNDWKQA